MSCSLEWRERGSRETNKTQPRATQNRTFPIREGLVACGRAMQLTTKEGASRTDSIAAMLLGLAVATALVAFALGRNDPSVRTAVLLCVTNLVTALSSIAATLLVGKPAITHQVETRGPAQMTTAESQTTSVQPIGNDEDKDKKEGCA